MVGFQTPFLFILRKNEKKSNVFNHPPGSARSDLWVDLPIFEHKITGMTSTQISLQTNHGTIRLLLKDDIAPKTCENFTGLARKGYYDGVIFHRVIPGFMIQGGDPTGTGRGGESLWGKPFGDECVRSEKFDRKGLLAMANAGPGTNGSQFFITTAETPWLHMNHTIFGEVTEGYEVAEAISLVPRDRSDKPLEPVVIEKVVVIEN